MLKKTIPTIILGGSGYVSAELIRLILMHPAFRLDTIVSSSHQGQRIDAAFPHLTGVTGELAFSGIEDAIAILDGKRQVAVFSAMPHGETAAVLQSLMGGSSDAVKLVDVSADFRLSSAEKFEEVYKHNHGAPEMFDSFTCALPDIESSTPEGYIAHPGCFTTCVVLGSAPLIKLGLLSSPSISVSAVTGSTGAGRQPRAGTHHPERQSAMWAYEPLRHRHVPEMRQLLDGAQINFVPHSGPFSRGIHATIFGNSIKPWSAEELVEKYQEFYTNSPFVTVGTRLPSVKEIVGSNRCCIGIASQGDQVVITSVIDNLVKGAAGGAVQWMNRLFALDEDAGLNIPMPGWI